MAEALDVVGIGNAIVDVLAQVPDSFITEHKMAKDAMTLIDATQAEAIYAAMPPSVEMSGGSAANTIAGLASLGAKCGFIGRVRNDQLGEVFTHDIRALGVEYKTAPATEGLPTARCLILVTPDGHRTMNTFLGASTDLGEADVDADLIGRAQICYLEGYLWDKPEAKAAFERAMALTQGSKTQLAFTLSDLFCVDRHRPDFLRLLDENKIDILFANEAELKSLMESEFDTAVEAVRGKAPIVVVTRSEKGALVISPEETVSVDAEPTQVVDTTGAGDLFAAGFLYGVARNLGLEASAQLGTKCAARVIAQMGPRPDTSLKPLLAA